MKRALFLTLGAVLVAAISVGVTWTVTKSRTYFVAEANTTCRLSPDELMRAWLVELHTHLQLDRNVSIRLEDINHMTTTVLMKSSPNEGFPIGSERFVWSKDSTKVLLVGRHFAIRADLTLPSGEQAYFFHDLAAHKSYCNSAQSSEFAPLTAEIVAGVDFAEPVSFPPRPTVDPEAAKKSE